MTEAVLVLNVGSSSVSGDLRLLHASDDPRAAFAIDYLVHHTANATNGPRTSRLASSPSAWVIPTDEAAVIARHTLTLIGSPAPKEYAP